MGSIINDQKGCTLTSVPRQEIQHLAQRMERASDRDCLKGLKKAATNKAVLTEIAHKYLAKAESQSWPELAAASKGTTPLKAIEEALTSCLIPAHQNYPELSINTRVRAYLGDLAFAS